MHTCNEIQRHPNRKDILNIGDFHSLTGFFYSYLPIEKISKKIPCARPGRSELQLQEGVQNNSTQCPIT